MAASLRAAWTSTSPPQGELLLRVLLEVQSAFRQEDTRISGTGALNSKWARWSSSGQDKNIYGSEFAGRLDFNQPTRGINPFAMHTREASPALIPCLKSKAPSNKEINAYLIQGL